MSDHLQLMAVSQPAGVDWMDAASKALTASGLQLVHQKNQLLFWKTISETRGLLYSNAWVLRHIWLAPGQAALGVLAKRLYFSGSGPVPDFRYEHEILQGRNRPRARVAEEELATQWSLLQVIKASLGQQTAPVDLDLVDEDLCSARIVSIKGAQFQSPPMELYELYREHGFDEIDLRFTVAVCPLKPVTADVAAQFSSRIESCCNARGVAVRARVVTSESVSQRAQELAANGESVKSAHCVLFILPTKDCELDAESARLFSLLEQAGVPFRRAHADDPLRFSIPNQLPSLIMAAGGRPHRATSPVPGPPVWTVGVDLGHARHSPTSCLVVTLVDPLGKLVDAWSVQQPRDETARDDNMERLLQRCRASLLAHDGNPNVLVFRDGRLFENETSDLYWKLLTDDLTLVELRKRGNPQVFDNGLKQGFGARPIAAKVPDSNTVFAITAPARGSDKLPKVMKITWRKDWNRLELSDRDIVRLIAASAAAPGLGPSPRHLPAAIYWADGIAAISPQDLRFRGTRVCHLD